MMRVLATGWIGLFKTTVAICMAVMVLGGAGVAVADTGPGDTGGGVVGVPGVVPTQDASAANQAQAKLKLAAAYFNYESGQGSLAAYTQQQQSFASGFPDAGLTVTAPATPATPAAAQAPSSAVALALTQHDQATSYYCGPSTAESIVEYLNGTSTKSRYNGVSLSQANLASSTYLQTTASAGTPWAAGRMRIALNLWTQGKSSGWYVNTTTPTVAEFQHAAVYDIYAEAHPLANGTVELVDHNHYNQHPKTKTIGHWVPAYGVSGPGDSVTSFADPAHSPHVSWGTLPAEYFDYASVAWTTTYLQSNGITW
jgi:hypothetical protein